MIEILKNFTLQLFADAGTLVNATGNFVNAYTGDTSAFDSANSLSGELKTFYDTELLENARVELFYAQFAKKQHLPANHGTTVEWRKWNTFAKAAQLQEGVIPTGQKFGMSSKTGAINQYGTYATVSDKLALRAYDDVILGATEEMGASAAETQETLIRDALLVNTNVLYCDNINVADGVVKSTPTSCATMEATATVMSAFTPDMVAKAVTIDGFQTRYDGFVDDHGHFRCTNCNQLYDFEISEINEGNLDGFTCETKDIYFTGCCKTCNQKN